MGSLLITSKLPLVYICTYIHESGHFRSLWISDYQNIPLSYKIRLNQVRPANKIHPYNHFSEYFLYFCSIGAWMGMKVWHHKTMHKKFKLKNEAYE